MSKRVCILLTVLCLFSIVAQTAYSEILVEDAASVWNQSFQVPGTLPEISPRIIVEYSTSTFDEGLIFPSDLVTGSEYIPERIVVQYPTSIHNENLIYPTDIIAASGNIPSRIVVEYATSIAGKNLIPLDVSYFDITFPSAGVVLNKGEEITITWDSANITGTVQIDLYKGGTDPGHMFMQLAAATDNDGAYIFNPADYFEGGDDYYIGISAEGGTIWNFSGRFTIPPIKCIIQSEISDAEITTGQIIAYRISIENSTKSPATGVEIINSIPVGTLFESATGPYTYNNQENTITWNMGTIEPGEIEYIDLSLLVTAFPGVQIINSIIINTDGHSSASWPFITNVTQNEFIQNPIQTGGNFSSTPAKVINNFGTLVFYPSNSIFNPAASTYVISHGWNPSGDTELPDWQYFMANTIILEQQKSGRDVNILLWNWQEQAVTNRNLYHPFQFITGAPFDKVFESGRNLAEAIIQTIPPTYDGRIHLIGHSLGSGVIMKASEYIYYHYKEYFDKNIKHLTLLDSPFQLEFPEYEVFLYKTRNDLFVDNYTSLLGRPIYFNADVNVQLYDLDIGCYIDGLFSGHGFSYRWYTSSIENFETPGLLCDIEIPSYKLEYGFYWSDISVSDSNSYLHLPFTENWRLISNDPVNYVEGVVEDVGNLIEGLYVDAKGVVLDKKEELTNFAKAAKAKVKIIATKSFDTVDDIVSMGVDKSEHAFRAEYFVNSIPYSVIRLVHNSDASIASEIEIPSEANSLRFSFEFPYSDKGGVLELFMDDVLVFFVDIDQHIKSGWQHSEWINISEFVGKTVNISFRLSNSNNHAKGAVSIDDIIFAQIIPSIDTDEDGLLDQEDNCPGNYNPNQTDSEGDGIGDECDNCPDLVDPDQMDMDCDCDVDGIEVSNFAFGMMGSVNDREHLSIFVKTFGREICSENE